MTKEETQQRDDHGDVDAMVVRPKIIGFSCVDSPSDVATSLERRANQGEDLQVELQKLTIDFTTVEYEPDYL